MKTTNFIVWCAQSCSTPRSAASERACFRACMSFAAARAPSLCNCLHVASLLQSLDAVVGLVVTMDRGRALAPGAQSRPRLRAGSDRPEQVVRLLLSRCAA